MKTQLKNKTSFEQYLISNPNKSLSLPSQIFPLNNSELTIGRTHDNNIQILDNTISKKHAKIQLIKDNYYLYDNQSANGIYLNGQKITRPTKLQNGDCIQFGKYQCLYKFIDKNSSNRNKSKSKGKINLKDYLFQQPQPSQTKPKSTTQLKSIQHKQSAITQPKFQHKKKLKSKQGKINIPNLTDYLKLGTSSEKSFQSQQHLPQNKFIRNHPTSPPFTNPSHKQTKIILHSLEHQTPDDQQLKQYHLAQRQKNLYKQQQQVLTTLQKQHKKLQQQQIKKQLQQIKINQDIFQKQVLLQQKIKQQQQKLQHQKHQLQQQFIKKQQFQKQQQLHKIQQLQSKQKQMLAKIQHQRQQQLQQLKIKQQTIKKQSQNQYKHEYQKRKKQLELQAEALARQYQTIYKQTIHKVRTQIQNHQQSLTKLQQTHTHLQQQSHQLDQQIQSLNNQLHNVKNTFIQINGRNKSCLLYASHLQDKIDALGVKQFKQQQQGYYKTTKGFNRPNTTAIKKLQQTVTTSRKLLKIKSKQYQNMIQQINSLRITIKQRQLNSSTDLQDFIDTIYQNLSTIQQLKQQYLQLVENQKIIQSFWENYLQQNSQLQNKNQILSNDIAKHIRQIQENSKNQIKKSTQQRLHLLKLLYLSPQKKKTAIQFLIQQMLAIQQQIHKYRLQNQQTHRKIAKIISQTQKLKKQNQHLSQILFSQDQNAHHFDNMKILITTLTTNISQQKTIDSIASCLQLTHQAQHLQLKIQSQLDRKHLLRANIKKIAQMGLAPLQININQKNPIIYFGDLLTHKFIQLQQKKYNLHHLQNQINNCKITIKLLQEKKNKILDNLQKYKNQQLNSIKKYLTINQKI